jgi:glycerol-3-phosphate dehydrogenase
MAGQSPSSAFTLESRGANLRRLRDETFDALIVGGGINGAGIARDLALRGLRVALVEQRHFASGTSGRNSQLIHGGLRYLKYFDFALVSEALRERATLLRIAPHLVQPQPFLIPFYGWGRALFYGAGLQVYRLLAGRHNTGPTTFLSRRQALALEPALAFSGLAAAGIFYDCKVGSARLVLENLFDAAQAGAAIVNYARATDLKPLGATVTDAFTGEACSVRARKVIDATGAWQQEGELRLVRGSHIVLPRLNASPNAIAYFDDQGRIIFVIPWGERGELSLVGTTDVDHTTGPDDVAITPAEVEYLLGIVRRLFPKCAVSAPLGVFSSLRPLLRNPKASATATSREHRIWNSPMGILHVAGGKYTTYRAMSQEASDEVAGELAPRLVGRCETAARALPDSLAGVGESMEARVTHAVRAEMAQRLPDVLFVSTYWGYERAWSDAELRELAGLMACDLGWDDARVAAEVALARRLLGAAPRLSRA